MRAMRKKGSQRETRNAQRGNGNRLCFARSPQPFSLLLTRPRRRPRPSILTEVASALRHLPYSFSARTLGFGLWTVDFGLVRPSCLVVPGGRGGCLPFRIPSSALRVYQTSDLGLGPRRHPSVVPGIRFRSCSTWLFPNSVDYVSMMFRKKPAVATPAVPSPEPVQAASSATEAPRKKILVIDDDPIMVKTLSLTLNAKGYKVISAADGPQAISAMREEAPDMMLVDVGLPTDVGVVPWNGFQVAQWLQRMNTQKVPAIIISGSNKPEYKQQAADIGAEAFMTKPIDNALLLASIASALANPAPALNSFIGLKMVK